MSNTSPDRQLFGWDNTLRQVVDGSHKIIPGSEIERERESWLAVADRWHNPGTYFGARSSGDIYNVRSEVTRHRYYHHLRQLVMNATGVFDYKFGELTIWHQLTVEEIEDAFSQGVISDKERSEMINVIASRNQERMRM